MWFAAIVLSLLSDVESCVDILESRLAGWCTLEYACKLFRQMGFKLLLNTLHDLIPFHVCRSTTTFRMSVRLSALSSPLFHWCPSDVDPARQHLNVETWWWRKIEMKWIFTCNIIRIYCIHRLLFWTFDLYHFYIWFSTFKLNNIFCMVKPCDLHLKWLAKKVQASYSKTECYFCWHLGGFMWQIQDNGTLKAIVTVISHGPNIVPVQRPQ